MKPKEEKIPLNLTKEAVFTVKLRDPQAPYLKFEVERKLQILEDGLHVIEPHSKKQLFFFPFPNIKTFRLAAGSLDQWQIYFKNEGKKFQWYTFISPEADRIHATVLDIVDNIVLDRDMFEAGDPQQ